MHESAREKARESNRSSDQLVRENILRPNGHGPIRRLKAHICTFGIAVQALAHHARKKPAAWLAHLIGGSERGAQHLIDGDRKVTAKAIVEIDHELLD